MLRPLLATLCAGALLLAACGDDDDTGGADSNEYAEAVAASMAEDDDIPFEPADIDCLSVEFVDALGGPAAFEEAGVSPEELRDNEDLRELGLELGEAEARAIAASFGRCDVSLAELVLADIGDDVPPEMRACVEENLNEEVLAEFFAEVLLDSASGDDPPEALLEPLMACF